MSPRRHLVVDLRRLGRPDRRLQLGRRRGRGRSTGVGGGRRVLAALLQRGRSAAGGVLGEPRGAPSADQPAPERVRPRAHPGGLRLVGPAGRGARLRQLPRPPAGRHGPPLRHGAAPRARGGRDRRHRHGTARAVRGRRPRVPQSVPVHRCRAGAVDQVLRRARRGQRLPGDEGVRRGHVRAGRGGLGRRLHAPRRGGGGPSGPAPAGGELRTAGRLRHRALRPAGR